MTEKYTFYSNILYVSAGICGLLISYAFKSKCDRSTLRICWGCFSSDVHRDIQRENEQPINNVSTTDLQPPSRINNMV